MIYPVPFLSKVLERIANHQLKAYLEIHNLLPGYQSAYRKMNSTETAVLKVLSDLVDAIEKGEFALLTLLNLSAAFDTVDHEILLKRLSTTFGINSVAYGGSNPA